jgi:hypothetical protein
MWWSCLQSWSDADWSCFWQGLRPEPHCRTEPHADRGCSGVTTWGPHGLPFGPPPCAKPFPRLPGGPKSRPPPPAPRPAVPTHPGAAQTSPLGGRGVAVDLAQQTSEASQQHRQNRVTSLGHCPSTGIPEARVAGLGASLDKSALQVDGTINAANAAHYVAMRLGGRDNTGQDPARLSAKTGPGEPVEQSESGLNTSSHLRAVQNCVRRFTEVELPGPREGAACPAPRSEGNLPCGEPHLQPHRIPTAHIAHAQHAPGVVGRQQPVSGAEGVAEVPSRDTDDVWRDRPSLPPLAGRGEPSGPFLADEGRALDPHHPGARFKGQRGAASGGTAPEKTARRADPADPVRARWASKGPHVNSGAAPGHPPLAGSAGTDPAPAHGVHRGGRAARGAPGRGTKRPAGPSRGRGRPAKMPTHQRPGGGPVSAETRPSPPSAAAPGNPAGMGSAPVPRRGLLPERQGSGSSGSNLRACFGGPAEEHPQTLNGWEASRPDGATTGAGDQAPSHAVVGGTESVGVPTTERPALQAW